MPPARSCPISTRGFSPPYQYPSPRRLIRRRLQIRSFDLTRGLRAPSTVWPSCVTSMQFVLGLSPLARFGRGPSDRRRRLVSKLGAEREAVQDPILLYGEEIGWRVLDPSEAITERGGESGMFLLKTLRAKLLELNPGIVTPANVDEIIRKLESLRTSIEGNFEALAWLRGERTVFVESQKQQRNVTLIDFEHPSNNLFHVTKEWRYTNGQHANRADVMFVVNGIPVALVETKAATKKDAVDIGLRQVRRYRSEERR